MRASTSKLDRWKIPPSAMHVLEEVFATTQFPTAATRSKLAQTLNVKPRRIQVWFQNRRQRLQRRGGVAKLPTVEPVPTLDDVFKDIEHDFSSSTTGDADARVDEDVRGQAVDAGASDDDPSPSPSFVTLLPKHNPSCDQSPALLQPSSFQYTSQHLLALYSNFMTLPPTMVWPCLFPLYYALWTNVLLGTTSNDAWITSWSAQRSLVE